MKFSHPTLVGSNQSCMASSQRHGNVQLTRTFPHAVMPCSRNWTDAYQTFLRFWIHKTSKCVICGILSLSLWSSFPFFTVKKCNFQYIFSKRGASLISKSAIIHDPEPQTLLPSSQPVFLKLVIMLSSWPLCLPSGRFPKDFPTKILYSLLISHIVALCILLSEHISGIWPIQSVHSSLMCFGSQFKSKWPNNHVSFCLSSVNKILCAAAVSREQVA